MSSSLLVTLGLLSFVLASAAFGQAGQKKPLPEAPDYSRYPAGLAGFPGTNLNEVAYWTRRPAVRSRIGERGHYKAGLTRLPNGDLLASPSYEEKSGQRHLHIFCSRDEGRTWIRVETQGDELLGKENSLICLRDGTVLLLNGASVSRSEDGGVTWKTTQAFEGYCLMRDVLEERDGSLLMVMSKGAYYNRSAPPSQAWLFRSSDGGRTWAEHRRLQVWNDPESMFDEASVVRLPDGRLLAAGRVSGDIQVGTTPPPRGIPTPGGDESGDHMILTESKDGGKTWSKPRPFLSYTEVHAHLLPLKDGRLLCTYASYHLPFGVFAILSEDGGKTWDDQHPIQLAMSLSVYTGWPTSLQLPGGDILTTYAITGYLEGEGVSLTKPGKGDTVAEAVRWKLPPRSAVRKRSSRDR